MGYYVNPKVSGGRINAYNMRYLFDGGNDFLNFILSSHSIKGGANYSNYLKAVEIIEEHYCLVLLAEHFAESLYLLAKYLELDIDKLYYAREYYTPGNLRKGDLPSYILNKLSDENVYDIMLHNHFTNVLLKQIEALPEEQKLELKAFKERNNDICVKQKLFGKLGVPVKATGKAANITDKTENYLESKEPDFYSRFARYFKMKANLGIRHGKDETDYISRRLEANGEYIIIMGGGGYDLSPSVKTAYELARSIYIINREKGANIKAPYMVVSNRELIGKKRAVRGIPVEHIQPELVKNKKVLIADLNDYAHTQHVAQNYGVDIESVADWRGAEFRRENAYFITGMSSKEAGGVLHNALKNRFINSAVLTSDELGSGGEETEPEALRNAGFVKIMSQKTDTVIYTADKMYDSVSKWCRENVENYFEVRLREDDGDCGSADLVIKNTGQYSAYELAFIIMLENTDFCCWLRGENKAAR
jgi:hypothetical protein